MAFESLVEVVPEWKRAVFRELAAAKLPAAVVADVVAQLEELQRVQQFSLAAAMELGSFRPELQAALFAAMAKLAAQAELAASDRRSRERFRELARLFQLEATPRPEHVDALALALCRVSADLALLGSRTYVEAGGSLRPLLVPRLLQ